MKKKKIVIGIIVAAIILVLLTPMPPMVFKDGGSKVYKSLTYTVYKYHKLPVILIDENGNSVNGDPGYRDGLRVEIFGIEVFDNYNDRYSEDGEIYLDVR